MEAYRTLILRTLNPLAQLNHLLQHPFYRFQRARYVMRSSHFLLLQRHVERARHVMRPIFLYIQRSFVDGQLLSRVRALGLVCSLCRLQCRFNVATQQAQVCHLIAQRL